MHISFNIVFYNRCGPCQQFTPQLIEFYNKMKKQRARFEIIWVSRDRTDEAFVDYYTKMPWLAVPIDSLPHIMEHLLDAHKVRGIPHFVLLEGEDASIITLEGREKLQQDRYGLEFPWRARSPR